MIARSCALGPEKIAISKTAVRVSPLHVPVAGRLAILEHVRWFSAGYAHIELTLTFLPQYIAGLPDPI